MKETSKDLLQQLADQRRQLEEADGDISQTGFSEVQQFLQGLAESGLVSRESFPASVANAPTPINQDLNTTDLGVSMPDDLVQVQDQFPR